MSIAIIAGTDGREDGTDERGAELREACTTGPCAWKLGIYREQLFGAGRRAGHVVATRL